MNNKIYKSINEAKKILSVLMDLEEIMYEEGHIQLTFAECVAYRSEIAVKILRNIILDRQGFSIRTRIALAAVLTYAEFSTDKDDLVPVYFEATKFLVPAYKWYEKNWGEFDIRIKFIPSVNSEDPEYRVSLMTGKRTNIIRN